MTGTASENFDHVAEAAVERLMQNDRVRRNLPGNGRLRFDRQLPFLLVHRRPVDRDDAGTRELVTTEAAYLFSDGESDHHDGIECICRSLSDALSEHFGLFLLLEVWSMSDDEPSTGGDPLQPAFTIVTPDTETLPTTVQVFVENLEAITIGGHSARVRVETSDVIAPPGLDPLIPICPEEAASCFSFGLAVRPIYRDPRDGTLFPVVLRELRRQLAPALRRTIHTLIGFDDRSTDEKQETDTDPEAARAVLHHEALGPTRLVKAASLVDQKLDELGKSFDFLLQVTPVNADDAYREFVDADGATEPTLYYRPCPYDPAILKRRLFAIPLERVEDVTLSHLFWEKQVELDRQISAIRDIGTPGFLPSSLQLYGGVEDDLHELATTILEHVDAIPPSQTNDEEPAACVGAEAFAERAREEIDHYHAVLPSFAATVEVCDHIASGIMVAKGQLLVAESLQLAPARVEPLLHHEVGVHLVTFYNGRNQPFRQLANGLAGYEALQEGLAVLAEYLVGGLTPTRLRSLAARVVAVRAMLEGATFVETHRRLSDHGLPMRTAFTTTLRVFRGGGLTKDAIYLRGLRDLLAHLAEGHEVEPLYVGKIALEHVPFIQELRRRGIVRPPAVLPRFWGEKSHRDRLEACRSLHVLDLLKG